MKNILEDTRGIFFLDKTRYFFIILFSLAILAYVIVAVFGILNNNTIQSYQGSTTQQFLLGNGTTQTLNQVAHTISSATSRNDTYLFFNKSTESVNHHGYVRIIHNNVQRAEAQDLNFSSAMSFSIWLNSSQLLNASAFTPAAYHSYALFKPQNSYRLAWAGFSVDDWEYTVWNLSETATASECKVASVSETVFPNQWVHVAGTFNGTTAKIFVNGSLEATTVCPSEFKIQVPNPASQFFDTFIGTKNQNAWENLTWNGTIDEVRVYNVTLSEAEVGEIYNSSRIPNTSLPSTGLIFWHRFNEYSGSTTYDSGTFGQNGTIVNATYISDNIQVSLLGNTDYSSVGNQFRLTNSLWQWSEITLAYTFLLSTANNAQSISGNVSQGITNFFSAINPIYSILAILVVILVLVVLVKVVSDRKYSQETNQSLHL